MVVAMLVSCGSSDTVGVFRAIYSLSRVLGMYGIKQRSVASKSVSILDELVNQLTNK